MSIPAAEPRSRGAEERSPTRLELKAMARLSGPIVLSLVGHRIMGLVDTLVAGRIGTDAQAGMGFATSYFWTLAAVFLGMLMGLEPFFSQASGRKDHDALARYLRQGLWLAGSLSVGAVGVVYLGAMAYVRWAPASAARDAFAGYITHVVWALPGVGLSFLLQRFWQSRQVVIPFTLMVLLAAGAHVMADLALGLGWWGFPRLGAAGLGIAATLSRYLLLGLCAWYTWRHMRHTGPARIAPDWTQLREFLRVGGPAGGQVALEVLAFFIASFVASTLGPTAMAAHFVCFNIATCSFIFAMGIAAAAAVRVGNHLGAGRPSGARLAGWLGMGLALCVMSLFATTYLALPRWLLGFFTQDAAVLALGVPILAVAGVFQLADGTQVAVAGALRGLGDTRSALVANLFGHFAVGVPVGLMACYLAGWGVVGLWLGLAAGLFTTAALLLRAWRRASREIESIRVVG